MIQFLVVKVMSGVCISGNLLYQIDKLISKVHNRVKYKLINNDKKIHPTCFPGSVVRTQNSKVISKFV